jgi:hypothetical protein
MAAALVGLDSLQWRRLCAPLWGLSQAVAGGLSSTVFLDLKVGVKALLHNKVRVKKSKCPSLLKKLRRALPKKL